MSVKIKIPPLSLTQSVTPDLEVLPPALDKDHKFGAHRVNYDEAYPMPAEEAGFCDGQRLIIPSLFNERNVLTSNVIYFYALGLVGLAASTAFLFDDYIPDDLIVFPIVSSILLVIGIILTIIKRRKPMDQFVVFDRDSGNVLFTGRKKWPDMVVPFEHVGCFTDHATGRGAFHFFAKLECRMRPKSMKRGRRVELFGSGLITNWEEAMKHWAYITRFMDKGQPIPQEPINVWKGIQWFARRGITMENVRQKYGHLEIDPELENWLIWDGTSPFDDEDIQAPELKA